MSLDERPPSCSAPIAATWSRCLQPVNHFHHNGGDGDGDDDDGDDGDDDDGVDGVDGVDGDGEQVTVLMFMSCQSAKRAVFDGSFLGGNMSLVAQLDGRV